MNQLKFIKWLVVSTVVVMLIACGGGSSSGDITPIDSQAIAIDKIVAYAENQAQPVPTIEDYSDVGVEGVNADNLDEINALVSGLIASEVDSPEKIQAIFVDYHLSDSDKKVFIIGDSTVYNAELEEFGWGSKMADYAVNPDNIINRAVGGASSKSYIEISGERSWEDTKSRILAADTSNGAYLLIQFGHNDVAIGQNLYETLAGVGDTYYTNLKVYVDWAKANGIIPVLVTPPLRKYYELPDSVGTHVIPGVGTYEPIGDYPETMRILAATEGLILIDLTVRTILEFEKYSYADLGTVFFSDDNNHWHEDGAIKVAGFVVEEICVTDDGLCAQFNP